jgi:DNA repair protein RadC
MDLYQVAEIELSYKRNGNMAERPKVVRAEDAYHVFLNQWEETKLDFIEQSKIMLLNRNNRVLGLCNISSGGISGTVVDPRLIFVTALKANASSIILAHNHPSGNLSPSEADIRMTRRIMDAGELLEVKVLDHIIVTSDGFYSFSEQLAYEKVKRGNACYYEALQPF